MADYEIKRRANIGTSSLILIFIVLCLATFSILSLENARREDVFSRKNAAAVQRYYQADRDAEAFVQQVDQALAASDKLDAESCKKQVLALAGDYYQAEQELFALDFAMDSGLALYVELAVDWEEKTSRVQCWKVVDRGELEIDQSVPVWDGE